MCPCVHRNVSLVNVSLLLSFVILEFPCRLVSNMLMILKTIVFVLPSLLLV